MYLLFFYQWLFGVLVLGVSVISPQSRSIISISRPPAIFTPQVSRSALLFTYKYVLTTAGLPWARWNLLVLVLYEILSIKLRAKFSSPIRGLIAHYYNLSPLLTTDYSRLVLFCPTRLFTSSLLRSGAITVSFFLLAGCIRPPEYSLIFRYPQQSLPLLESV